jgi:hypothetical protein
LILETNPVSETQCIQKYSWEWTISN